FFADTRSTDNPPFFHMISTGAFCACWRATLSNVSAAGISKAGRASMRVRPGRLGAWTLALLLVSAASARGASVPLFRLFLTNGTVVSCLGEYARVGDRVVFTTPLGDSASQLLSLPSSAVDWPRTEQYSESLRATRYAESRGEADFSGLAGEVAAVLNEIALTNDPARKLQLALAARRRLDAWPRD